MNLHGAFWKSCVEYLKPWPRSGYALFDNTVMVETFCQLWTTYAKNQHLTWMNFEGERLSTCKWRSWSSTGIKFRPMSFRPKKIMISQTSIKPVMEGGGIDHPENRIMPTTPPLPPIDLRSWIRPWPWTFWLCQNIVGITIIAVTRQRNVVP